MKIYHLPNPIAEYLEMADQAMQNERAQVEAELRNRILQAPESRVSKRAHLGLEKKHRAADMPLFSEQKGLFS